MGFWDNVFNQAVKFFTPNVQYLGARSDELEALFRYGDPTKMTASEMWKSQPHLRTVVSFLARNTAQLGLHVYRRTSEDSRVRDRTSPLPRLILKPNPTMTMYDLIFALVGDKKLYDRAYWWLVETSDGGRQIWRIPPNWITPVAADAFQVKEYNVVNFRGAEIRVPASEILAFSGYHPNDPLAVSPSVDALRDTLNEQIQASLYRHQVWKNGGRVSAVLERPLGAKWSTGARDAFRDDWYAKWTGRGDKAGGTPILEDGMTLKRIDFSAQEQQFVEAAKLAMVTVAGVFHVNPTMVGVLDNANYSNVKEFRKALYAETLGPDLQEYQDRINTFLLPMLGMDPAIYYAEFNVQQKLQGDFEEQAAALQTAVGRPWIEVNEARSRLNMAALADGNGLAIPMAVSIIGLTTTPPTVDSPASAASGASSELPKALPAGRYTKGRASDAHAAKYRELMQRHFKRQRASIVSRFKARKADPLVWDAARWDKELTHDLTGWGLMTTSDVGRQTLIDAGVDESWYHVDQTEVWVSTVCKNSAENINQKTYEALMDALEEEDVDEEALDAIFGDGRIDLLAIAAVTTMSSFATNEAGKQGGARTKTWITGPNARPEHAALNGETVGIDEDFSNGLPWPGASGGAAEDIAGCNCSLQMNWED